MSTGIKFSGTFLEDLERKFRALEDLIINTDAVADEIAEYIITLHELGEVGEAEMYRQRLAHLHFFGQMSAEGPII